NFVKRHGLEIALAGVTVVLCGKCVYLEKEKAALIAANASKTIRIDELVRLCHEKDLWFLELISDGLRHGSSFAGKCMQDRKMYLKGA
ncbi:MAG: hypothetical protein ACI36T_02770, partial [Eggerthellaceae bacterium]